MNDTIDKCSNCQDFSWTVLNGLCKLCRGAPPKAVNPFAAGFVSKQVHTEKSPGGHYRTLTERKFCQKGHPWVTGNIIVEGKKTRCKTCRVASTKAAIEARKAKSAIEAIS